MKRHLILTATLLLVVITTQAQGPISFRDGEEVTYNLYYNWQFVWLKAGTASMSTVKKNYNGQEAYCTALTTRGSDKADQYFIMRDTLLCYYLLSDDLPADQAVTPVYYRKGAREGKRYYVDEVFYDYPSVGRQHVRQHQLTSKGKHEYREQTPKEWVYDMITMFERARGFDPTGWQKGHKIDFDMVDGHKIETVTIKYLGKSTVKADNGKKYRCLQLSYLEKEKGKLQEIVRFFVTDDDSHVPVRLDMNLRVGTAKAFLTSYKGSSSLAEVEVK